MNRKSSARWLDSFSDNRKSKIQNRKLVGIFAIVVTFVFGGAVAKAQQPGKIFRIGFLDNSTGSGMAVLLDALRRELSQLGWIEGKNIAIEYRFAEVKNDRLPELAAELVRLKVDLIVVSGVPSASAAEENDHCHPHRDDKLWGPCGYRFDCQPGATGRQYHRALRFSPRAKHEKARDTQGCSPQACPRWSAAARRRIPTERD